MSDFSNKPLFNINILTPKAGMLDEFIRAQLEGRSRLGSVRGLTSSQFYRAEDSANAILISGFDSVEAFRAFQQGAPFQEERARLAPLVESVRPGFYRLIQDNRQQ